MSKKVFVMVTFFVTILFLFVEPAFAGPGGKIASAAFETFWGRVILAGLTIILLPFLTYAFVREKLAERRAYKDLRFIAAYNSKFDWLIFRERAKDCFFRVHSGWENEDLSTATSWMTDWYWQNQQLVHLDRWRKEGLQNICNVRKITGIKPLLFVHRNRVKEHEDSMIVLSIEAKMQDYLQHRNTGAIIKGSKRYKEVETVWSFTMEGGVWKVSDIEEGSMSLAYAKLAKGLPAIESTLISDLRA